jgi:hypothetical protein
LHTHVVHHPTIDIAISPRLLITAPAPECGKTTLLEAVGELSANPLEINSISAAAFFRLNDAEKPTLLIDEIQGMLGRKNNEELQAILLASHRRRSAKTVRVEEQADRTRVAKQFDGWGTYAATLSGRMSYALESRCLKVKLRRAFAGEVHKHLQDGTSPALVDCRRKFARWVADQVGLPDVALPDVLANRTGDNWRPLLRLAAGAGGDWPDRIMAAAKAAMKVLVSRDVVIALLADVRTVIGLRDRILTVELVNQLLALENPSWDWSACYRGGAINPYWLRDTLADVLHPSGTREWKVDGRTRNGYLASQFDDAYRRYLLRHNPDEQPSAEAPAVEHARENDGGFGQVSATSATGTKNPSQQQQVPSVADAEQRVHGQSASATDKPEIVADADQAPTYPAASATSKKRRRKLKETVPVADEADQTQKTRTSLSSVQKRAPKPLRPQPDGEWITEKW